MKGVIVDIVPDVQIVDISHAVQAFDVLDGALTISQATVAGTGFNITGLSVPQTINAGASVSFTAQFAPTTAGSATGSVKAL